MLILIITGETQTALNFFKSTSWSEIWFTELTNSEGWILGTTMFANTPIIFGDQASQTCWIDLLWKLQLACEASLNICIEVLRSMGVICFLNWLDVGTSTQPIILVSYGWKNIQFPHRISEYLRALVIILPAPDWWWCKTPKLVSGWDWYCSNYLVVLRMYPS